MYLILLIFASVEPVLIVTTSFLKIKAFFKFLQTQVYRKLCASKVFKIFCSTDKILILNMVFIKKCF